MQASPATRTAISIASCPRTASSAPAASPAGGWWCAATISVRGAPLTRPSTRGAYAERLANGLRLAIVRLVDGTGGGSVKSYEKSGRTYVPANPGWDVVVDNVVAKVPVLAACLGPVAGLGAARVVWAVGRSTPRESGAVDNLATSEDDALPRRSCGDEPRRAELALRSIVPRSRRQVHDMRTLVKLVVDRDSLFELSRGSGGSVISALGRLDGYPVAVVASDPRIYGGGLTAAGSDKLARFVDFADTFHPPVVNFVDQPGFVIGVEAERAGTSRRGALALAAIYQARVPWVSILVRKVFGVAGAAHGNAQALNLRYA